MYGVYEVYTWDDVSYTKLAEYETEEEAKKECKRLKEELAEKFTPTKELPVSPVSYTVMSNVQYYTMMK